MRKQLILKLLSALMFATSLTGLKAQINDFKLSDYKLADYKRQGIDVNFSLVGSNYNTITEVQYDDKNTYMNLANNLRTNYFLIVNKRKYQGTNNANLSFGNSAGKNETDTVSKYKNRNYSIQTSFSSSYRFYNPKEYFILLSVYGNLDIQTSKDNQYLYQTGSWQESDNSRNTSNNIVSSGTIGVGKGRIEPVEDARQAIYILDELKKNNKLKREPSNDEILAFSKRISELKNERVLDSRLKKIDELNKIDSFLIAIDLIENADMTYFSRLNDMWDFGGLVPRNSGFSFQLSYNPIFSYRKAIIKKTLPNIEDNIKEENTFSNNLGFAIYWNRPFRQKLQSNFSYSLLYFNDNHTFYSYQNLSNGIRSNFNYGFGIYPSTRTSMNFGLSLSGSKSWNTYKSENSNETYSESYSYSLYPSISVNYYFSPNLRLYCTYNTNAALNNNLYNSDLKSKNISNNIEIRLLYSIF